VSLNDGCRREARRSCNQYYFLEEPESKYDIDEHGREFQLISSVETCNVEQFIYLLKDMKSF
jgi:hypothetical protein